LREFSSGREICKAAGETVGACAEDRREVEYADMSQPTKDYWIWSKLSSSKWEDAWEERLAFLPPGSLVVMQIPGSRTIRLEAYTDQKMTGLLKSQFGGSVRKMSAAAVKLTLQADAPPLRIRGRLLVTRDRRMLRKKAVAGTPEAVWIPAGLAFGTGSHATTAGCLRLLTDWAAGRPPGWRMADLGCGSGILAICAEKLGAGRMDAVDYDPNCVRITEENGAANGCHHLQVRLLDVLKWRSRAGIYDVIGANLYSDILLGAAEKIAAALKPGAVLIFSGVLRDQWPECQKTFRAFGLQDSYHNPRGKWVFGRCQKAG